LCRNAKRAPRELVRRVLAPRQPELLRSPLRAAASRERRGRLREGPEINGGDNGIVLHRDSRMPDSKPEIVNNFIPSRRNYSAEVVSVFLASRRPRARSHDESPCPSRSAAAVSRSFCSVVQRRRIVSSLRDAFGFRRFTVSAMARM
jgi:hypothetical protein